MTEQQINERLFDIVFPAIWPGKKHSYQQLHGVIAVWVTGDFQNTLEYFYPATSVDALRKRVLPEIVRRKKFSAWYSAVLDIIDGDARLKARIEHAAKEDPASVCEEETLLLLSAMSMMMPGPAVLAAAALEVLEADHAK